MLSKPPLFLNNLASDYTKPTKLERPHVTLTFAQSLDAKIAGAEGRQLILSSKESLVMTHWMRTMHDAILVGIGTALNDDPQLNVRYLPDTEFSKHRIPLPVILDANLRLSPTCRLLKNFQNNTGRQPWVLCSSLPAHSPLIEKKEILKTAGARVIEIPENDNGKLSITAILKFLHDEKIQSVMVEGGAQVIASFLAEPVVDNLVITVAPVIVGCKGVGYEYSEQLPETGDTLNRFEQIHTELFGRDTVIALTSVKENPDKFS